MDHGKLTIVLTTQATSVWLEVLKLNWKSLYCRQCRFPRWLGGMPDHVQLAGNEMKLSSDLSGKTRQSSFTTNKIAAGSQKEDRRGRTGRSPPAM